MLKTHDEHNRCNRSVVLFIFDFAPIPAASTTPVAKTFVSHLS